MSKELPLKSVASLQEGYRSGSFTPSEVLAEVTRRMEAGERDNVWILRLTAGQIGRQLDDLESRRRSGVALPLYGVPFAVKDNYDVERLPTTAACPDFSYVAEKTATVVSRLTNAGAILVGKTNMDQFATGLTGTRSPYGVPRNPYGAEYVPGGSSSGSAVAVGAGTVTFSLGTDTAGSGRVPAGFNNIVGIKPTRGLLSIEGIVPACRSLDCASVFAADVSTGATVTTIAQAEDPGDIFSRPQPASSVAEIRSVGILRDKQREFFGDESAARVYERGIERLGKAGIGCKEIDFSYFREAAEMLYNGPWMAERDVAVGRFIRGNPDAVVPVTRAAILGSEKFSAADAFRAYYKLRELRRQTGPVWNEVGALYLPTTPTIYKVADVLADPSGTNGRLSYYTNFVNLLDLCAVSVPSGYSPQKVPIGATFVAPAFHDKAVWRLGEAFMRTQDAP
jgi:allophanate hydrolase